MINEAVIPTIAQTIRTINQPQVIKPSEVITAITPVMKVEKVSNDVSGMDALSVYSINTHA
jgi:hypothetical protein